MSGRSITEQRRAGVLAHLSSLPGGPGNGDLGAHSRYFVDWLANCGFSVWQMLPLGPTHEDLCPYQCLSVHAADPGFIDLQQLVEAGYLSAEQAQAPTDLSRNELLNWRYQRLRDARAGFVARNGQDGKGQAQIEGQAQGDGKGQAQWDGKGQAQSEEEEGQAQPEGQAQEGRGQAQREGQAQTGAQPEGQAPPPETNSELRELRQFRACHSHWLEDYALYMALRRENEFRPWWEWPQPLRDRQPQALEEARERLGEELNQVVFEQFIFFRQWAALRAYAAERGVLLFGDMPIFVAHDSAEVWAQREYFDLGADGQPLSVAGVPPDYFAADGQRWGNPHYNWQRMAEDGFKWWLQRLETQLELFDFVRLDHFRGLAAYWSIPVEAETARDGHWEPAPGHDLLTAVAQRFGQIPLVAEDLGIITDDVVALREQFALPGMKVLQFAFDSDSSNPYLPHNHTADSVVYTGTHDNDTTMGWYADLEPWVAERMYTYLGHPNEPMPWPLVRASLASVSGLAILPLQDLLALGSDHRMNIPGVAEGNWRWRFEWEWLPDDLSGWLWGLNHLYGRV
ncbi:4-alpha-glucanotransferase [Halorhodospira halochloris]|uniref:4-alpha-glucanotransferase n=1 Tax=Halorhodospira halochloris TaxID=1052 RepID=UPI001EE83D90|nr:4-alpha-glucanotransferase [Halorhodospira halochloris]MCG5549112.1 4-alpha-glucanotransferase [Halorhodospira halochloris]